MVSQITLKRLGPALALYTSSFDGKCKFVLLGRCSTGPPLARGPIRRNRSNRLKNGPGGVAGGASTPANVFICWKSGKFRQNPWKSEQNPWKFDKNGAQRCLTSKNGTQGLQKNKWRPFFGGHATKTVGKSCTTTFWASLGNFVQKSFASQKFACSYTYAGHRCSWNRQDCNRQSTQRVQNTWLIVTGWCLNARTQM